LMLIKTSTQSWLDNSHGNSTRDLLIDVYSPASEKAGL